ncbi:hypothetical protein DFS33DRAFT_1348883 [Desarmillaria ectypa]|nr:hypothetical protein DFS33DRAFT_1348883 [Desarmillaria ectypa]
MSPSPPTRREFAIVCLLLVSVLYFFSSARSRVQTVPLTSLEDITIAQPSNNAAPSPGAQLIWGASAVPQTQLISHVPGWTIFDKLYLYNGTIYVVCDDPQNIPDVSRFYSKGLRILNGKEAEDSRLPTKEDIQIISSKEANALFGVAAQVIDGVTHYCSITHYYHWSAELGLGLWRAYSSLDHYITHDGNTTLPPPRRIMFNRIDATRWRDYAAMNQWFIRSAWPSLTMEFMDDWKDRISMGVPFVFERVLVADRSAAMMGHNYARFQRTAAVAFPLPGSAYWWMPIRDNVVKYTGLEPAVGSGTTSTPVITYISRQEWGRRMLIPEDHDRLVRELYKLRDEYGYEVNVVSMDKLSRKEQIRLAARTTIMMGVHGNGLTSLLWMNPSPRSTVIEFFFPGGFAHDYEFTTRALGMIHYGFWGSQYVASLAPLLWDLLKSFQAVARLCRDRLTLTMEDDD